MASKAPSFSFGFPVLMSHHKVQGWNSPVANWQWPTYTPTQCTNPSTQNKSAFFNVHILAHNTKMRKVGSGETKIDLSKL